MAHTRMNTCSAQIVAPERDDRQSWIAEAHAHTAFALAALMMAKDRNAEKLAYILLEILTEQMGGNADYCDRNPEHVIRALNLIPFDPDCGPDLAPSARRLASALRGRA